MKAIDVNAVRNDFPILGIEVYGKPLIYLDNAATTQKPRAVLECIRSFYSEKNGNVHRATHYLSEKANDAYEKARETVRRFINAPSVRSVVFTHGATSSINLVARSFGEMKVRKDDEIVVTEMEHHSNLVPWQLLCERSGAKLRVVPFDDTGKLFFNLMNNYLSDRTRIVAVTHVSNVLGVVNPIKEIISLAHERHIPVLVDGAQAIQHLPIDVVDLDCDFYAFSGHKIYAETGVGVLYGKESLLELMPPYEAGGGMIGSVDFSRTIFADLPFKFEAGTPNIAGAISMAAAIEYINSIGLDNVWAHERELLSYAEEKLSRIIGVKIYGKSYPKCGVVSFNLETIEPYDACMVLDKLGIALRGGTHCAEPIMKHFGVKGMMRASFALYNTKEEIDILVTGIKKVQSMMSKV